MCIGIGIGYKSIVKLKFSTQPIHQIYVMKYCTLLKTSYQHKNELPNTSMAFHDDSFQV